MDWLKLDVVYIFQIPYLFNVGILYLSGNPGLGWDGLHCYGLFAVAHHSFTGRAAQIEL